jgi:hypothetical protein
MCRSIQPLLPISFDGSEKRTHFYVRNGTTNLLTAALSGPGYISGGA